MPTKSNFGADLERKLRALSNLRPATERIAREVQQMSDAAFDSSRSPEGRLWAPLAPSTLARRKPGEGRTPLNKTGATKATTRVKVQGDRRIVIQVPAHLVFSQAGKGRMRREVLPIEHTAGKVRATKRLDTLIRQAVDEHIRGAQGARGKR